MSRFNFENIQNRESISPQIVPHEGQRFFLARILFLVFALMRFLGSANAQLQLTEDIFPGNSSGVFSPMMGDDYLFYSRRNVDNDYFPAYFDIGSDVSVDCPDFDTNDYSYYLEQVQGNTLYCTNSNKDLIASDNYSGSERVIYHLDSIHQQEYMAYCKNEAGDVFFMLGELAMDSLLPSWYQQLVIYEKPAGMDTVIRIGKLSISYYHFHAEEFKMVANDNYVVAQSNTYNVIGLMDCLDISTGQTRNLLLETDVAYLVPDFTRVGEKIYIFDGINLFTTDGAPGNMEAIVLPYNSIGVGFQNFGQLTVCGQYLLFKGLNNDQVSLIALNTQSNVFSVLGTLPWDVYRMGFVYWKSGICCILSRIYPECEVWYFDLNGNQTLVEKIENTESYEQVQIFANNEYVFWLINADVHSMRYSRLIPFSTFDVTVPEYSYNSTPEFFPYPSGFYMRVKSQELGNEMFHFKNPIPALDYSTDFSVDTYPNPFTDHLQVNFKGCMKHVYLKVFDATGKLLLSQEFIDRAAVDMDLSHLDPGVYHVQLLSENKNFYGKVIKS
jgi:hypothetical protein